MFVIKDPVAVDPWDYVLDATTEKNKCIQKNLFMHFTSKILIGEEDCLYLNVYTPEVSLCFGDTLRGRYTCGVISGLIRRG